MATVHNEGQWSIAPRTFIVLGPSGGLSIFKLMLDLSTVPHPTHCNASAICNRMNY